MAWISPYQILKIKIENFQYFLILAVKKSQI